MTLGEIVKEVRAEAGHALTPAQGLNTLETLYRLIRKTEEELWTAFEWPQLIIRVNIPTSSGQYKYAYDASMGFDQIRGAFYSHDGQHWTPLEYGIAEDCIGATGDNNQTGPTARFWEDANPDIYFRVWPTPSQGGWIRFRGMRLLTPMLIDTDMSTLDGLLLAQLVASKLLTRAKAEDAQVATQAAQRHLQKLLANKVSNKHKVSTMGANRRPASSRLTPYLDYIP